MYKIPNKLIGRMLPIIFFTFFLSLSVCCQSNNWIAEIAQQEGVPVQLVYRVIEQESSFNQRAISHKGAIGLMQLMPGTARRFNVNPYNPVENVRGGTKYLRVLLKLFNNRVDLALAAYNAGEGKVIKYGYKVPPYQETQNYVRKILQKLGVPYSPYVLVNKTTKSLPATAVKGKSNQKIKSGQMVEQPEPTKPETKSSFLFQ